MTEEAIFLAALEKQDPTERGAYLDSACAGNPDLRKQVEALLRSHDDPGNVLDRPIAPLDGNGATQPDMQIPSPDTGATESELAMLGPAREPGSLGSLDHYEVLEFVGRGGMGVVFKACDTKLQRIVAIKLLAAHLAADGTSRKRFVREAQAAAAIRDAHVDGIHAVHDDGAVPYLVMEFIDGVTLAAQIKAEGTPALEKILRIGMQAAEGLAAAHKQGVIHRDIKPANILLENGVQRVKIVDFGLARVSDQFNLTQPGILAGTPAYMAPEQTCGESLTQQSDLFSLGSVLYFVCTGRHAFTAAYGMVILKRVAEDTPTPIRRLNPDIPDWLAAIVDKLMAKDPKDRFQSAADVAEVFGERLARIQRWGNVSAPPVPPTYRGWIGGAAACVLGVSLLALVVWMGNAGLFSWTSGNASAVKPKGDEKPGDEVKPPLRKDPNVLTVSQKSEDGGEFQTITAALKKVKPGMIIRVLDDAVYVEQIKINEPDRFRGLVLEAAKGKKPTLRLPAELKLVPPHVYCVGIVGVANVTLRGFKINAARGDQVFVTGVSPGAILEKIEFVGDQTAACVGIVGLPLSAGADPVQIRDCIFRTSPGGIFIQARQHTEEFNVPRTAANVIIRNNDFVGMSHAAIVLFGAPERILIVGNRMSDCQCGIDFREFLPTAKDVLVANNTILRSLMPIRIWDEKNAGLECKNIRIQNNLLLAPLRNADFFFFDHKRGIFNNEEKPGDIEGLLKAWRFSHNWREIVPPKADDPDAKFWIPGPKDTLKKPIEVLARERAELNFLKPAKNSPLAKGGADDAVLPKYVGAVPPEGVEAWNWDWSWDAFVHKRLKVSKTPADKCRFATIGAALAKVEPGMTIRVLDTAVYEEKIEIDDAERQRGVVLEAADDKKPTIRVTAGNYFCVAIKGVPHFKMRGLRFEAGSGKGDLVFVTGAASGVVLEGLEFVGPSAKDGDGGSAVSLFKIPLSEAAPPIEIRKCTIRGTTQGITIDGMKPTPSRDVPQPCSNILIRENQIASCKHGVMIIGTPKRVHVVANIFSRNFASDIILGDILPGTEDLLLANNSSYKAEQAALRVVDDGSKKNAFKAKNIRIHNNLVLEPRGNGDFVFFDIRPGNAEQAGDSQALLKAWRFSHNWREIDEAAAKEEMGWIPGPNDALKKKIEGISRKPGDPDFLRPAAKSLLASEGASTSDKSLPSYVGAVAPEGAKAWDWSDTWKALVRKQP